LSHLIVAFSIKRINFANHCNIQPPPATNMGEKQKQHEPERELSESTARISEVAE
jgi:hypothetical protein